MTRSKQISVLIAEVKKMMGFLFLFRFRAFDGTVKTFKRQFYPFQGDAPSCVVTLILGYPRPGSLQETKFGAHLSI
jgi:hypothetical protein